MLFHEATAAVAVAAAATAPATARATATATAAEVQIAFYCSEAGYIVYINIWACLFQVFQVPSSSGPVGSGGIAYQIRLSSFKCLSHFEIAFSRWGAGWNVFARGTFRIHTPHSIIACKSSAERIGTWKNVSQ